MQMNPSLDYITRVKASLSDCSADFIGIADATGKLLYLNAAAYRMMGYDPGQPPVFETIADVHANDFDKYALEVIQPAVFANGFWNGTGVLRHKSGAPVEVSQYVFPVFGEDGTMYGTAAIMKELTDVEIMNARIRKNNELFQKVLDSIKIGIVMIDMDSKTIEMINHRTTEMLQLGADEIIGKKCHDILCHRPPAMCPHEKERETQTITAERFIQRNDGTTIPIIKTGTWIRLDNRDLLVDTLVDISLQKDLEKNLFDAKLSAEAANRSKSEFLSRMSHEMRTPLNAVIGMTQIAARTDRVEKLREALDTIEVSSKHLLGLINDVLDLSKIEEGKLELSVEPFSPRAMLQKIHSLIEPKVAEKKLCYLVEMDGRLPERLEGDAMRLSQVLLNFLSNAVKFTPEGGRVSLSARVEAEPAGMSVIRFSVADSGIGMSDAQLSRLFKPFTQADGSISSRFGGTGLGLAISKQIVGLMGSDIEVTTGQGEGSTFSFSVALPVASRQRQAEPLAPHEAKGAFLGKRALIVDDIDINRMIVIELLSETGLAMDEAEDGLKAVEMATGGGYDLVFMDVQMPVMDGYEATRQIRALEKPFRDVPIVAMSANVFREDIEQSLSAGMNAHIGKPIDVEKMISVAAQYLLTPAAPRTGEAPGPGAKAALKKNYASLRVSRNIFDLHKALEARGGCERTLAEDIGAFLADDSFRKAAAAMDAQDAAAALPLISAIRGEAESLFLPSIIPYAANVAEYLRLGNREYAAMYFVDLARAFAKTTEALERLIEKGKKQ